MSEYRYFVPARDRATAKKIMGIDWEIWERRGFRSGSDVEKGWRLYRKDWRKAIRKHHVKKITAPVFTVLEDNNYHTTYTVLGGLGHYSKRDFTRGMHFKAGRKRYTARRG